MTWPPNRAILGDSVTLQVDIATSSNIDSVVYYLGPTVIGSSTIAPYSLLWSVSGMAVGPPYTLSARAYDAEGRDGVSETLTAYFQWELMWMDSNDPWPTDLRRVYARTTNDYLILRVQTSEPWNAYPYPKDTTIGGNPYVLLDTSFATAIYIDTDRNQQTGRQDGGGYPLNGMGADKRILIGFFGGDTTLSHWSAQSSLWILDYDTTGLAFHDVPPDSNTFIIAVQWADLDNSTMVDFMVLNLNLDLSDPNNFSTDLAPDLGVGVISIDRADRWLGGSFEKSVSGGKASGKNVGPTGPTAVPNPFNR